jgi:hypothetical protein
MIGDDVISLTEHINGNHIHRLLRSSNECLTAAFHVASMSRGAAGKVLEALKTNGNFCDMMRHGIAENAS